MVVLVLTFVLFYFGSYTSLEHAWHVHIFARLRVYVSVRLSLSLSLPVRVRR